MKLLIITQKVDKNDDVLGFFHGWIKEFAKKFEKIQVIALEVGEYDLPENVQVFSLGKERGSSKLRYLLNFYKYIWKLRKEYDKVFVHMNKEYILLGWKPWFFMGKKIYFWYNHKKGGLLTRLAVMFSKKVFYTSKYAYPARFSKSIKMPAGIDTKRFIYNKGDERTQNSILSLGRISPVKNIDIFIKTLDILEKKKVNFKTSFYGDAPMRDEIYYKKIREKTRDLEEKGMVEFFGNVSSLKASEVYKEHEIFVNMTDSGSFDKTILEAMASGCLVLVCNKSFEEVLPSNFLFKKSDFKDMAQKIENILELSKEEKDKHREEFRNYVVKNHDLKILLERLSEAIK